MKILLVEDNPGDAYLVGLALRQVRGLDFSMSHETHLAEAMRRLSAEKFDVLLLDLSLPDSQGLDTVRRAHAQAPDVPIVIFTGTDDEGLGTQAVALGAEDYLVKGDVDGWSLARAIRYATQRKKHQEMDKGDKPSS